MTQASRPQASHITNFPLPSDPGPYSADQWAQLFQILFTGDQQATQGPLIRYLNELVITDNGTTEVYVAAGAGIVNGHLLISSEQETWAVPAGPAGGRQDRVVMVENNTNVEVTQTVAARPLLFPNDLSEYTATPGVPPYSARLAIVRGDDLNNLPVIDQTTALYMVELARYSINNVPTISAQADHRVFCHFATGLLYRRQGGSAASWRTPGTTNYIPAATRTQAGVIDIPFTSGNDNGSVTVTFPIPFSNLPIVFGTVVQDGAAVYFNNAPWLIVSNTSATQATLELYLETGEVFGSNGTLSVSWLAIGP